MRILDAPAYSRAQADARFSPAAATPKATAVVFGTSLEFLNGNGPDATLNAATTYEISTRGWWNWCASYISHRLKFLRNAGINGNTTTQMLARIDTDVLAYDPGWIFIGGPANDPVTGISSATTVANLIAIIEKLRGRKVVLFTCPTRIEVDTPAEKQTLAEINQWIVDAPTIYPFVQVVDIYRLYLDPSTAQPAADTTVDGIHYSEPTAHRIGYAVAQAIATQLPQRPRRSTTAGDPSNVLADNGMLTAGWTNTNPTDSTLTFVNDDDTFSKKARIVITGNTGGSQEHSVRYVENISGGRWAAGNKIRAEVRIRFTGLSPVDLTTARRFHPILRMWTRAIDNTSFITNDQAMGLSTTLGPPPEMTKQTRGLPTSGELVLRTGARVIPSGVDRLYVDIGWLGAISGTLEISEPTVIKLP